jgi:superoxide dismutase, Fe-Mn family
MPHQMKPLGCDPQRIKGMSEKLMVSHYENNYGGAVKRLNLIEEQLAGIDFETAPGYLINGLKREQLIATNSMVLHELFFSGLGEESAADAELMSVIRRDFGSYDRWRSEFIAMGKAQGGGSGWVLLTYSPRDGRLTNQWAMDHTTTIAGGRPILALDIRWITAPRPRAMSMHSWQRSVGRRSGAATTRSGGQCETATHGSNRVLPHGGNRHG